MRRKEVFRSRLIQGTGLGRLDKGRVRKGYRAGEITFATLADQPTQVQAEINGTQAYPRVLGVACPSGNAILVWMTIRSRGKLDRK